MSAISRKLCRPLNAIPSPTRLLRIIDALKLVPVGRIAKWVIFLIFLVNARSWPFMWHYRVFQPAAKMRLDYWLMKLRTVLQSQRRKAEAVELWFDSYTPVGADPFEMIVTYHTWAGIDDIDFNGHLSNSSYAKTLDCARLKAAVAMFPQFFRAGGWMPLAGTNFSFIREIPMFASYEVRMSIGSWDQKWIYVLTKFVSIRPTKNRGDKLSKLKRTSPASAGSNSAFQSICGSEREIIVPFLPTPPYETCEMVPEPTSNNHVTTTISTLADTFSSGTKETDGMVVHAVAVSMCCFKVGRITVPPALVIALHGFAAKPSTESTILVPRPIPEPPYSLSNPPSHWCKAKSIVDFRQGGSVERLRAMLRGDWKDVPENERWWESALGGKLEEMRLERLREVKEVTEGMAKVRML